MLIPTASSSTNLSIHLVESSQPFTPGRVDGGYRQILIGHALICPTSKKGARVRPRPIPLYLAMDTGVTCYMQYMSNAIYCPKLMFLQLATKPEPSQLNAARIHRFQTLKKKTCGERGSASQTMQLHAVLAANWQRI